ncbi:MAG: glucan biosynthesis protein G [Stagnimonas sp.]|nr:glucan biosynthesis protein G [Stagnimonas sp.]
MPPALPPNLLRSALTLSALLLSLLAPAAQAAFGFEEVAARAQKLSRNDYAPPAADLPKELRELSYDQYRDIRFKPERSLWRGNKLPFELQLFHPGLYYNAPVKISMVSGGVARPLAFDPSYFDYGRNQLDPSRLRGVGYAGFRIHHALNRPDYKDEFLVFQGASYFRALGAQQRYGMSARGLAVDTALHSGEEFPTFTEFWIEIPAANAKSLTVYALLDSRRVTGAYKFVVRPGSSTAMDIQARLFLRESVGKLGIAPLTSMFYRGSNQDRGGDDYRPEVHDSDGLLVAQSNGEWIWRPLVNPRRLITTSFGMTNPKGFGLLQRRRDFSHYEDLEARYDLRPSAWVEPKGAWGAGRVELVLIPTPDETNDNIAAYWVPNAPPAPGQALDLQYRLSWQMQEAVDPPVARVVQTRRGQGYVKTVDDSERLIVDFEDPPPPVAAKPAKPPRGRKASRPEPAARPAAISSALWLDDNGEVLERQTFRNEVTGGWRLSFRFRRRDEDKPVEMRAYLKRGNAQVSETWSYILPPN